jgi:ribonucleotide reductase alpha subunit
MAEATLEAAPDWAADDMSDWALQNYQQKYAMKDEEGEVQEVWPDTAYRVVRHVLGALGYTDRDPEFQRVLELVVQRKFMPGGRYLYAAGRPMHQVNNCTLYRCEDSREGWSDCVRKAMMALMTGAGVGVVYSDVRGAGSPIKKTGGEATGPISVMEIINEAGRHIMQGGNRRSAIWAGLHWDHPDCEEFMRLKDWPEEVRQAKEQDFMYAARMDQTNISVILNNEFFFAYENRQHPKHELARRVYKTACALMVSTGEPGFSIDIGPNEGENLRNAPVAGDTHVLTDEGYQRVVDIVGNPVSVWTGMRWAHDVVFERTMENVSTVEVAMTGGRSITCEPTHEFLVEDWCGAGKARRLEGLRRIKAGELTPGDRLHVSLPLSETVGVMDHEAYTLGFIYGDGSFCQSGGADLTLCTDASKACLPALVGARSVNESDGRGYTRMYFGVDDRWTDRTKAEFPEDVFAMGADEVRSFLAGLFDADGNWEPTQRRIRLASKHEAFLRGVSRALEQVGILSHVSKAGHSTYGKAQSYQLVVAADYMGDFVEEIPVQRLDIDVDGYRPYRASAVKVLAVTPGASQDVYCADVKVPEHSFMAEGVIISNCTEITSYDDSDICNLGSLNLSRFESLDEFREAIPYATLFLLAGSVYSDVPHEEVRDTRERNRRLGLGLMGIHEWLLKRGRSYEPDEELGTWLEEYARSTEIAAEWADKHGLSHPIKTRAIAPNGTIAIVAETTGGCEPIFCVAYKRRVRHAQVKGKDVVKATYVIDPTAERLIQNYGVDPYEIEDAYSLSLVYERRIAMQAWLQQYVDHGISSTINLHAPITDPGEAEEFADTLYRYLPKLRGITCYPDGVIGGQPLTAADYWEAHSKRGVTFEDSEETCKGGVCGA